MGRRHPSGLLRGDHEDIMYTHKSGKCDIHYLTGRLEREHLNQFKGDVSLVLIMQTCLKSMVRNFLGLPDVWW